jgi:hypothetical protein
MNERSLQIDVVCYAGYRGEETPERLTLGDRRVGVSEVIDRWLDPRHRYFKLRGDDGSVYLVRHDVAEDIWELTLFDSGGLPTTRLSST